jgi:dihydroorotate dehydrogenase
MSDVILDAVGSGGQSLYYKVSPDLDLDGVDEIVGVGERHGVRGYVVANTTTHHDKRYVPVSLGKGGASGRAVRDLSKEVHRHFADRVGDGVELIACGGVDSSKEALERLEIGNCKEIQLFTGLIYKGTSLLGDLRMGR